MTAGTQSHSESDSDSESTRHPPLNVCESRPGTAIFLEPENTDGWIATDLVVDVRR